MTNTALAAFLVRLLPALAMLLLPACTPASDGFRFRGEAQQIAAKSGFSALPLEGGGLRLAAFVKNGPGQDLVVYIEGDGRAFLNRNTPSPDPTPGDQLVLRLAGLDPAPKILYLARPCQFTMDENPECFQYLWTSARYGRKAVSALSQGLDQAKLLLGATRLHLVGYSGGGAMAVLLAAGRTDVADILTVSGNLDTAAWTAHHNISPLGESLNPADFAQAVAAIPQTHITGANDTVVPGFLCRRYLERTGKPGQARCVEVEGIAHGKGLEARWPSLLHVHRGGLAAPAP